MRDRKKLGVLIDTTFLLPTLGMEVEREAEEVIPLFREVRIHYMEVSLLEASWIYAKLGLDPEPFELGLEAVRLTYDLLIPGPSAYSLAFRIYDSGHRDLIDNLLYASAKESNLLFLTIDRSFIRFLEDRGWSTSLVITPSEFQSKVPSS
ncbi:MAG: PIN domain-containing protein [Candidatus Korarchaeota archaeon]|nr:PIN domain-containing protein [Candidatus Korarchaeota archaeon]